MCRGLTLFQLFMPLTAVTGGNMLCSSCLLVAFFTPSPALCFFILQSLTKTRSDFFFLEKYLIPLGYQCYPGIPSVTRTLYSGILAANCMSFSLLVQSPVLTTCDLCSIQSGLYFKDSHRVLSGRLPRHTVAENTAPAWSQQGARFILVLSCKFKSRP